MGIPTQGATISVRNSADSADILIGQVTSISGPSSSRDEIDDTNLSSTAKEYLLGLIDNGEIQLSCACKPGDAGQQELHTMFETDPPPSRVFKITLAIDTDAGHSTATTISVPCRVQAAPFSIETESRVEVEFSLRSTGARTIVWGAA